MADYIVNIGTQFDTEGLRKYQQQAKKAGEEAAKSFGKASKEVKNTSKEVKNADKEVKKLTSNLLKISKVGIAAGLGIAASGMALIVKNTMDAEREMALLESVIKSTGGAAGYTAGQVDELSNKLSRMSTISSGEINEAASRMLTYTDIVGEQFPRAMQNAVDWSTRYGVSVVQAAETIGKAIQKPSAAAGALAQQGFKFTKEFIDQLKELENTGRLAEAQALMFEEIESGVKGAAEAMRNTFGGAVKALKNTFNDVMTGSNGSLDGMTESINNLTDTLNDPKVQKGISELVTGLVNIGTATVQVLAHVPAFADWVRWLVTGNADLKNYHQTLEEYTELAPEVERMTAEYTKMGWSIEKALDYDEEFRNMTARVEELSFALRGITFDNFNVPVAESSLKPQARPTPTSPTFTPTPKVDNSAQRERNKLDQEYASILKSLEPSLDTYTKAFLDINTLYATGKLDVERYHEALTKIAGAQDSEKAAKLKREMEDQKKIADDLLLQADRRLQYETDIANIITSGAVPGTEEWNEKVIDLNEEYRITQLLLEGHTREIAKQIAEAEKAAEKAAERNKKAAEDRVEENEAMKKAIQDREDDFEKMGRHIGNAFSRMMDGQSVKWKEVIHKMALDLAKSNLMRMLTNIGTNMGGGWGALIKGIGGGFANGGAFSNGVQMFANGGIVNGVTPFGMSGGKLGIMGEAGPEAIMPLKRGSDGKLGVAVTGGGGSNISIVNNVTVNGSDDPTETAELTTKALEKMMDSKIKQVIQDQKRTGNMLGQ